MKFTSPFSRLLVLGVLLSAWPLAVDARSYSSGGGHSYSSPSHSSSTSHSSSSSSSSSATHSSSPSHSFSSPSHSFSSPSHSFSSPSHSFSSGSSSSSSSSHSSSSGNTVQKSSSSSGKSYSSGSSSDDSSRRSYSSGKSYSSGASSTFSSSPKRNSSVTTGSSRSESSPSASDDLTFDTAAARARKEQASKDAFTHFNEARNPPPIRNDGPAAPPVVQPSTPPIISRPASTRTYRDPVYVPDRTTLSTRSVRVQNVFQTYYTRPIVRYRDPYSSLFWWWLLDQSLDDRAMWTYQHRSDMDAERYQALLNQDAQLQTRVEQLEAQQTPADPAYVPTGLDRDLMYSDEHVQHTYSVRPTTGGSVMFGIFGVILAGSAFYFFVWVVFIHRWQTSSQSST